MSSIQYKPLSDLMLKFEDIAEDLNDEFASSDISWGSESQKTLADSGYLYEIIDEHLHQQIDNLIELHDSESVKKLAMYKKHLETLERVRNTPTLYYCMEE